MCVLYSALFEASVSLVLHYLVAVRSYCTHYSFLVLLIILTCVTIVTSLLYLKFGSPEPRDVSFVS
jgi:hypothetical protein